MSSRDQSASAQQSSSSEVATMSSPYILYLAMLSIGMGQTVIYAVMPALGRELGLDAIVINIAWLDFSWHPGKLAITSLSAMTALVFALVSPFWGRRSDRVGRKPIIVIGLLGYAAGTMLFNAVAYLGFNGVIGGVLLWALLIGARVIHASIMSATFPASNAYIIDVTPIMDRAKGLGRLSAANQLGVLMGPVMAGAVVFGFLTPLFIQAAITFCCAILVLFFLKNSKDDNATEIAKNTIEKTRTKVEKSTVGSDSERNDINEVETPKLSMFDKRFRFILPVGFLLYIMQGMVQQTLGFYCEDVVGMARMESVKYYATAMMASSIMMLTAQFLVVQRSAISPMQLMRVGIPFCAAGYAVIALSSNISGVLIGMGIFGFGVGMVMPGFAATTSYTVSPQEQGSLAGITAAVAGLGFVVGPLMGGAVYDYNYNAPYFIAAVTLAVLALYVVKNPRFDTVSSTDVD